MHHRAAGDPARREKIRQTIVGQIDLLRRYESVDGGWGYLDQRVGAQKPATSSISFWRQGLSTSWIVRRGEYAGTR